VLKLSLTYFTKRKRSVDSAICMMVKKLSLLVWKPV